MKADIYSTDGKKTGIIELPEEVFNVSWSGDLVHDVIVAMQSNKRLKIAHTKNRGDVRGGGKKPWRQKGTGRARHGSIRSPIWKGGGVTFGPRNEKNYSKKINKRAKTVTLAMILSRKLKDKEILFVESLSLGVIKTSDAKAMLNALSAVESFANLATKKKNSAYIATTGTDENIVKSFQNMGNVTVDEVRNVSPLDLLTYKYLILANPADSIEILKNRVGGKELKEGDEKSKSKAVKTSVPRTKKKAGAKTKGKASKSRSVKK